jgi:class 3 adenylate cyclase/tetratricopeptide (TPR) repeat protein
MFCDMVDSVRLSTRLDPEDLRDLIAAYQYTCAQAVELHNGYIARYLGDGILAYFGYPAANEDDAERAARAGLELLEAVTKLNRGMVSPEHLDLRIRVGIATGLVVVGDDSPENVSKKDAIAGEAVNLAARLQAVAKPNTVVTSALTRQLAAERFEYRDLGTRKLKGFAKPVPIYEIVAEREISRFAARHAALTPFVGRDTEIEAIAARWTQATSSNGQIVVISGEAGIGKSRIAAEACDRIRRCSPRTPPPLLFQCSPHYANAPLYPIVKTLERMGEIDRSNSPEENFNKLRTLLKAYSREDYRNLTLIADLLGLKADARRPRFAAGPTVKRNLTMEALGDWFRHVVAPEEPSLILFEDVQWIDPTSKILLKRLVDWAQTASVLIIITLRSDNRGAKKLLHEIGPNTVNSEHQPHITVIDIHELAAVEAKKLATAAAEGIAIPQEQLNNILAKADGIPLYLEELVGAVVHRLGSSAGEEIDLSDAVPDTLRDALMAQLDRLGHIKEVVQHGSVIGHEFSLNLLAKILERPSADLYRDLRLLISSKILIKGDSASDTYCFRHALLRDTSYRSLLRKTRRHIHLRVAGELTGPPSEIVDASDDLIAQHYSRGEAYPEAVVFWQRGAKAAIARSAHQEALAMLHSALADLRRLRGPEWRAVELDLVITQAIALRSLRGYSAPEVEERLLKARELCLACGDSINRFNVEWGLFQCTIVKRNLVAARKLAADLFDHARRHPNLPLVDANLANGMVALNAGEFETARAFLEKGVSLSRPETDQPHFFAHGQNSGLFCLSYLARTLCFLGNLDSARSTISRCLSIASTRARDRAHIYGNVNALMHAVRIYNLCGDLDAEQRLAIKTNKISRRNHFAYYEALSTCHLGWVAGAQGDLTQGINKMVAGLGALERTATSLALPGFFVLLAQLYLRAGEWNDASKVLEMAVGARGHAVWDGDVERVKGDMYLTRTHPDMVAAEKAYRSSLAIARKQAAGLLIFKAGFSLARLLRSLHRQQEGYEILGASLGQLHGEFGTGDVRKAKMLMQDLATVS